MIGLGSEYILLLILPRVFAIIFTVVSPLFIMTAGPRMTEAGRVLSPPGTSMRPGSRYRPSDPHYPIDDSSSSNSNESSSDSNESNESSSEEPRPKKTKKKQPGIKPGTIRTSHHSYMMG